jgi:hypothetical protein
MPAGLVLLVMLQVSGNEMIGQWSSYVLGQRWDFSVSRNDAEQSPRWSVFLDDPPLSPRQAVQVAKVELNELVPDAGAWRLNAVRMVPLGVPDGWIYVVEFGEPPPRPDGGITSSMGIVVLMNGHAVLPTHSPWPEKK